MTYSLVRANTVTDHSATGVTSPVTTSCVASTAGNLLVLVVAGANSLVGSFTGPAGWSTGATAFASGGTSAAGIFYLPNCPAGITSVNWSFGTAGSCFNISAILEFHDSAGSNPSPLDVTGSINSDVTTPVPIATSSSTTAAHELVVSMFEGWYASATKDTITNGTGFTIGTSIGQAVKQSMHAVADYQLDTGASSGVTLTDSVTFTGPFTTAAAGVIATFQIASAGPPPAVPPPLLGHRQPARDQRVGRQASRGRF